MSSAGSPGPTLEALEGRFASLRQRLQEVDSPDSKAALKGDIIALFRDVEQLSEGGGLRERIRELVAEFKRLPAFAGESGGRPRVHSDRLNSSTFVARGWNFITAERPAEAVAALEQALDLWPENAEATSLLGLALIQCGRYEEALACLRGVLAADPANEMALVNLGFLCLKQKDYREAGDHLSRALDLGRDRKASLYALHYLGLLHAERDECEEALGFFKRAIDAGPNLIEAYYHMGLLLYRCRKVEEARAVWRSATEQSHYNPYARKAQALLEELEAGRPIATA